jgi:hypothetical protein
MAGSCFAYDKKFYGGEEKEEINVKAWSEEDEFSFNEEKSSIRMDNDGGLG